MALDAIDEIRSPDFYLHIRMEGKLESSLRKAQMKQPFEKLMKEVNYDELILLSQEKRVSYFEGFPSASFSIGNWRVIGHLLPVLPENRGRTRNFVGIVSGEADSLDDIGKTKNRLYDKAKHYKDLRNVIIALRCDVSNDRLSEVLFGSQQITVYVHNDMVAQSHRQNLATARS